MLVAQPARLPMTDDQETQRMPVIDIIRPPAKSASKQR
jgi:hypothetical protein